MAPMITTNTVRYKLGYVAFGLPHVLNFRFARGTTLNVARTAINVLMTTVAASFGQTNTADDFTFTEAGYAPEDDINFQPIVDLPTNPPGLITVPDKASATRAKHTKFVGRGGGKTYSFELFGIAWGQTLATDAAGDGVVLATENEDVADCITALQAANLVSIMNVGVSWKAKAFIKVNDYWYNKLKP